MVLLNVLNSHLSCFLHTAYSLLIVSDPSTLSRGHLDQYVQHDVPVMERPVKYLASSGSYRVSLGLIKLASFQMIICSAQFRLPEDSYLKSFHVT